MDLKKKYKIIKQNKYPLRNETLCIALHVPYTIALRRTIYTVTYSLYGFSAGLLHSHSSCL